MMKKQMSNSRVASEWRQKRVERNAKGWWHPEKRTCAAWSPEELQVTVKCLGPGVPNPLARSDNNDQC